MNKKSRVLLSQIALISAFNVLVSSEVEAEEKVDNTYINNELIYIENGSPTIELHKLDESVNIIDIYATKQNDDSLVIYILDEKDGAVTNVSVAGDKLEESLILIIPNDENYTLDIEYRDDASQILSESITYNAVLAMIEDSGEKRTFYVNNEVESLLELSEITLDTNLVAIEEKASEVNVTTDETSDQEPEETTDEVSDVEPEETTEEISDAESAETTNETSNPEPEETTEEVSDLELEETIEEVSNVKSEETKEEASISVPEESLEAIEQQEDGKVVDEQITNEINTFSYVTTSSSTTRTHSNGIYTVKSGDTFNNIARSFNLSSYQMDIWNSHISNINSLSVGQKIAVTRQGVESMLSSAEKSRLAVSTTPIFKTRQEFINSIAPLAVEIANQNGEEELYASIMIAQAAHESAYGRSGLSSPPYYNLSGIKGNYNGHSVLMWTWEYLNGQNVNVLADFRKYPSYKESLQNYANLIRYGLKWSPYNYSGMWKSKSANYLEAIEGLKGLHASYATDPNYFNAIRRYINDYDLTQYDSNNFKVQTGTFFGNESVTMNAEKIKRDMNVTANVVLDESIKPYQNKRVEATLKSYSELTDIRNKLKSTFNIDSTYEAIPQGYAHRYIETGFFNSKRKVDEVVQKFRADTGWWATTKHIGNGKYTMMTGYFNKDSSLNKADEIIKGYGYWFETKEYGTYNPYYTLKTESLSSDYILNNVKGFLAKENLKTNQVNTNDYTYYYRLEMGGFSSESKASQFVKDLSNDYGWWSMYSSTK